MKTIFFYLMFCLLIANISFAAEKKCSDMKKLSKEFIICSAKNLKDEANKKNSQIKKGSAKKTQEIAEGTKKIFNKLKSKIKTD